MACPGGLTVEASLGQYVKYGSGWPHTPPAPAALKYLFGNVANTLSASTTQSEIVRALTEWTRYGNLSFSPGAAPNDLRSFYIYFARGDHGDGFPFDGPGGILAHGFYPAPPNPESIAGDMHFDLDETWTASPSGIDVFSVALHEAGHALGLAHSDNPQAVMYAYYRYVTTLHADDIAGIQDLYGAAITQAPSPVSVTPSSGSGASQTFTFVYSDAAGYANLTWVNLDIHTALSSIGACYIQYDRATNTVQLANDGGSAWAGAAALGASGTLQNSQCAIDAGASSASGAGNNLTLVLSLSFKAAFAGGKNIYMGALNSVGLFSGWQTRGTWTVTAGGPQAPSAVSVTPSSGSGPAQSFRLVYSDAAGYANLAWVNLDIHSTLTSVGGCYFQYNPATNVILLANDAGTAWAGSTPLGSAGSLQNSQCALDMAGSSASGAGNNLTLNLPLSFKPALAGARNIYMGALNRSSIFSGWQIKGTWTVTTGTPQPPAPVSVTPSSGSGPSQTFTFVYSDPNGYADLTWVNLDFQTSLTSVSACYLQYDRAANTIRLANDSGSDWIGFATLGAAGALQNSQCSLNAGASSATMSGNNLTVQLALTFKPAFSGSKNVYMGALSDGGVFS
ncbi:MAG: matrixin family metalloprotease, partial [Candidatus Solibacter usitatus]|nr:matrixin family metalloprotease [Candidatus Solibacter usitatus]